MSQPPVTPAPPQPPPYNPLGGDHVPPTTQIAPRLAKRRRSPWPWVLGSVAAVMLLCVGIGIIGAAVAGPETQPGFGEVAADTNPTPAADEPTTTATTSQYVKPRPADFKLVVKTLKKECFGSAGCLVTYRVDPTYIGSGGVDPSKTYRITYEVRGVEDGPAINNFELTGETASMQSEELAQTPSKSTKLTAKATEVIEE